MTGTPDRLARLVRQHARASQLAGVDFVPFRPGAVPAPAPVEAVVERPQPARPSAAPRAFHQEALPAEPAAVVEPKVVVASPTWTDPERIEAQRLLDDIRARYEKDAPHKHFVTDHHCIVFGEGDPRARLMFIGEAPGAEEDKVGRPFVGRAGQLLDKMIQALGLERPRVYIANVLKTRPPNNATPTMDECARCAPYLFEQIGAVRPEVIVTLGKPASGVILNSQETMGRMRGRWAVFPPPGLSVPQVRPTPVMPTFHPAYLLRAYTTENRKMVWSDLKMAAERLGLATSAKSGA
jgi:DNA polymerase